MRTFGLIQSKQRQHRWRHITQRALFFALLPVLVVRERDRTLGGVLRSSDDERDLVGRMGRVWRAGVRVYHLLRVTVIGRDDEGVAGLLACFVDSTDGCISVRDRFDGSLKDTRMADLSWKRFNQLGAGRTGNENEARTISGGAKLHMTNSCLSDRTTSATLSATPCTLIFGSLS